MSSEEENQIKASEKMETSDEAVLHMVPDPTAHDHSDAIRVVESGGRSSAADIDRAGNVEYSLEGRSPRMEEGTLKVCHLLVERRNQLGGNWEQPTVPLFEQGVDCEAKATDDRNKKMEIQVVRIPNQEMWRTLATTGHFQDSVDCDKAANALREAISHKERKIPLISRSDLTLAIDCRHTAGHAVKPIVKAFQSKHGAELSALGFESIWIVGPAATLVTRLDC